MTMTMNASSSVLQIPTDTKRRSVLRRFIDAVIEGRRRKAAQQLAIFLEHHKHSLRDDVKIELQRRLLDACKPDLSIGCNRKEDRRLMNRHVVLEAALTKSTPETRGEVRLLALWPFIVVVAILAIVALVSDASLTATTSGSRCFSSQECTHNRAF